MRHLPNRSFVFAAFVLLLAGTGAFAEEHAWSYEGEHGPAHWGDVKAEYAACKTGKHQSPIDIRGAKVANLPAIQFSYAPASFRVVDNGHSFQVNVDPGSFVTVGDKRYDLVQFHFHHPSEERINGRAFPMVAHLVHKDAEGKLAVVAVLLQTGGHDNPVIATVWKNLPAEVGQERASDVPIDVARLLPASRGYYTFTGSLTTPPCSEDVTWFVLKKATEITKAEEALFAQRYPHNTRPVQPLNGRVIQATK